MIGKLARLTQHREAATSLALFRILLGSALLYNLWRVLQADLVEVVWVDARQGGLARLTPIHWWFSIWGPPTIGTTWWLLGISALGACCTVLGVGRWIAPLLTQQAFTALRLLNTGVSGGYDPLITIGLLLLALSGATRTLSLDCWLDTRRWTSRRRVLAWPRYLLIAQLVLMYTLTGLQKVGISWTPFGGYLALHYILHDPTWTRFSASWVNAMSPLLRAATAVAVHWEQLAPVLLVHYAARTQHNAVSRARWVRLFRHIDARASWALVGLGLHFGIAVLLDVGPFSWVTLSYYVLLWGPNEWHRAWRALPLGGAMGCCLRTDRASPERGGA